MVLLGNFTLHYVTDVIHILQGKLEGCTVNSQDVILNHTTYYLNPDVYIWKCGVLFYITQCLLGWLNSLCLCGTKYHLSIMVTFKILQIIFVKNLCSVQITRQDHLMGLMYSTFTSVVKVIQRFFKQKKVKMMFTPLWHRPREASLCWQICHKIGSTGLCQMVKTKVSTELNKRLKK